MKATLSIIVSILTAILLFSNQELDRQIDRYKTEIRKLRVNLTKVKNFSEVETIIQSEIIPIMQKLKSEKEAEKDLINFYREYKELFNLSILKFIQKNENYLSLKLDASINRSNLEAFFTFFTLKKEGCFFNINSISTNNDMTKIEFDIIELYKK